MLVKLIIAVALLALGAAAFFVGLVAPDDWRRRAHTALQTAERVAGSAGVAEPAASSASALITTAAASTLKAASSADSAPTPREQLWPPVLAAAGARYALQAGQFPAEAPAQVLAAAAKARGNASEVLVVKEADASLSWVVTLGQFASEAGARAQAARIADSLGLAAPLTTIVLPAATVASSASR